MLLPNEWIENSIETYIYQHTTKSQIIYWVVLAAVTAAMIALPFIYVDISVQGSGVVRPITEKTENKIVYHRINRFSLCARGRSSE